MAILDIATADEERLAKANGPSTKTVDIEQSFVLANGDKIKGTYAISEEKYKALQGENRQARQQIQADSEAAGAGGSVVVPGRAEALQPISKERAGGHTRGNSPDLLNRLILQQANPN